MEIILVWLSGNGCVFPFTAFASAASALTTALVATADAPLMRPFWFDNSCVRCMR